MTPTVPVTLDQIRAVDLFDGLDDDELEAWREATQAFRIASGAIVHEQDTSPRGLLLLLDGGTRMYKLADERFEPIGHMHAPTWMQAIAALTETPVGVRMVAEGDCVIGLVPIQTFQDLALKHRSVHRKIMAAIGPVTARLQAIDNDRERLASLGTMAAGLAHELNNPAAAVQRAASQMADTLDTVMDVLASFVEAGVEREGAEKLVALQREAAARAAAAEDRSTVDAADAEDEMLDRLEDLGVEEAWRLAEVLASADLDDAWLSAVRDAAGPGALSKALAWVAATLSARGLAEELQESAARMSDLVGAIKTYSYMDRGEVVIVDVREGIKATVKVLGHKLKHTNIRVVKEFEDDLPRLSVHGSELNQVWTNLIDNAVDAMGKDGTLTIRARVDGPCVQVDIGDDGPGIPEESRRRILEPFYTTKEPGKGTGLGLDTVRRIVEDRHDGSISFDTGADGTTFHVWLPITGATPSLARAEDINNEETPR
ncbi:ATP-binding protein [Conexibacter woesei]|uniref:ATP-binding protein n=1 Tax=Conexibacter woesei TaxID=191495 RepID=UPI0003FD0D0C|nr:ATP-binding protein [Conexibacter woesei]